MLLVSGVAQCRATCITYAGSISATTFIRTFLCNINNMILWLCWVVTLRPWGASELHICLGTYMLYTDFVIGAFYMMLAFNLYVTELDYPYYPYNVWSRCRNYWFAYGLGLQIRIVVPTIVILTKCILVPFANMIFGIYFWFRFAAIIVLLLTITLYRCKIYPVHNVLHNLYIYLGVQFPEIKKRLYFMFDDLAWWPVTRILFRKLAEPDQVWPPRCNLAVTLKAYWYNWYMYDRTEWDESKYKMEWIE